VEHRCRAVGAKYLRGPRSVARKRNLAVEQASYDIILFVDSDCLLTENSLAEHLRALRRAPGDVAGAAGRTVMFGEVNRVWKILQYSRLLNACFDFAELYTQVAWGVTCNLSVRREVFQKLGGFAEENYTLVGGEDVDLGIRATEQGYRWITAPRATVLHRRDSIARMHHVLCKLFTYGQADVFLMMRHPHRRTGHPNPFAVGLIAALGVSPALASWPTLVFMAMLVPYILTILMNSFSRRERETLYGTRLVRTHGPVGNPLIEFLRKLRGAAIDEIFDAGILWEALRRGRPHLSLYHFAYANEKEFVQRDTLSRSFFLDEPDYASVLTQPGSSTRGSNE
jgi:hypothetical protein